MRTLTPAAAAVLAGPVVPMAVFVEMLLTSPLRLNTSAVNIEWNGQTWAGTGVLGAIEEAADVAGEHKPMRLALSGVPSELLAVALAEPVRSKAHTMYLAILDPLTHAVLDAPRVRADTLDQMSVTQSGSTSAIAVTSEHPGARYARPKPLRYTDADQQRLFPGDTSLRFVTSQSQVADVWPAASWFRK